MYLPASQIKPNLYTNGGEYVLSTTKEEYKGYYYQASNGNAYTGKTPQDGFNILLIKPTTNKYYAPQEGAEPESTQIQYIEPDQYKNPAPIATRIIPPYNITKPTPADEQTGAFTRYFCKKTNENIYLEINRETYNQLKSKDPKIAWDLYTPQSLVWYIKGDKEKVYTTNRNLTLLLEQQQQWYGFSQYLKEDFSKYLVS
jgi:hypothetical protein